MIQVMWFVATVTFYDQARLSVPALELEIAPAYRARVFRPRLRKPLHDALNVERVAAPAEGNRGIITRPFLPRGSHFESIVANPAHFLVFHVPHPSGDWLPQQDFHPILPLHL
jgi:hypothetical protein